MLETKTTTSNEELNLILLPNNHFMTEWKKPGLRLNKIQIETQNRLAEAFEISPYEALFKLAFIKDEVPLSKNLKFWRVFINHFIETLRFTESIELLRENQHIEANENFYSKILNQAPFFQGSEYLNQSCLQYHWQQLNLYFQVKIKSFKGTVEQFFKQYSPDIHLIGKIYFHLVETKDDDTPFAFMATYSVGLNKDNKAKHRPLQYALTEYEQQQDKLLELLSTVQTASEKSKLLKDLLESGELFYPLNFTPDDSFQFLNEIPVYEESGILCRIPNWWRNGNRSSSISVSFGDKKKSLLGMESLIDFNAKIMLGDIPLTPEEAETILRQSEGLSYIKGKWVVVDKDKLSQSLENWRQAQKLVEETDLTLAEAMRMLMIKGKSHLGQLLAQDNVEVCLGDWIVTVLEKMRNPQILKKTGTTTDFKANLRPYQQAGLNWLAFLNSLQFGACLADDMGLGKTVQVIALINSLRKKKNYSTSLLVLPASLIHNWESELSRFSPKLKFAVAHPGGSKNLIDKHAANDDVGQYDLIISTYGIAKRYEWIHQFQWHYIILDEAQAIKNVNTAQTKAIKKLNCKIRLALTGTPIENNLSDLWSLFDFLNPGLLGSHKEFSDFIKKSDDLSALRQVISPYILRRLKTDKKIISDLPDKIEVDSFSFLSKVQHVLYQKEVDNLKEALNEVDTGIKRKGLVLSTLMKFKQICNHPDQFLGNSAYLANESGKFLRLQEICETIREKREKVLIFTQFKEITNHLADFLADVFGFPGLVLHGSISVKNRKAMLTRFQSDEYVPFFILSLKAGGVGLNLTAANHVIHFDRWWNPATENQATDRAFRIGQKKSVVVHKFITTGTVEEKIAAMLEEKKQLSEEVLAASGEAAWITEMTDSELVKLFSLEGGLK